MRLKSILLSTFISLVAMTADAQGNSTLSGSVSSVEEGLVQYATVSIDSLNIIVMTDRNGGYFMNNLPLGKHTVTASFIGYEPINKLVKITGGSAAQLSFQLTEEVLELDDIVITGTKTFKRKTESPVIVNVLTSKTLESVQACNLAEGLKFQPGLRVETDCQTCNYTQLRINGLTGGYSQILINGRPIFSPLTGLYGLEQLPVNMVERIEVVRGGGSSLYGSSAIGGTVNVVTKIPQSNAYELGYTYGLINGQSADNQFTGNLTLLNKSKKAGVSLFANHRRREFYDHNDDNFSELPEIENTSLGANFFYLPKKNQKFELSLSNLNEYRFGGEMGVEGPASLALQSEERTHHVWMASADYQINFNNENTSIIAYLAGQYTDREHYTGIIPDDPVELERFLAAPPYGISEVTTFNGGVQLNHRVKKFITGSNVFTFGAEYIFDEVYDDIPSYNYLIDQTTEDLGVFIQSDWNISPSINLLSGVRLDDHNLVDRILLSPRASLLYKFKDYTQFRLNYSSGFRAPQAFDTDLHIAFAGGGISRVQLSSELAAETSESISASINYDKAKSNRIAGFTLEAFHTVLNKAFILQPLGEDEFGEVFEKQNGSNATVQGVSLELRANFNKKIQLETGFTIQESLFDESVEYIDGVEGINEFIRTPNQYGFATLNITPSKKLSLNLNYVYTGSMVLPHFAGAPNQLIDEMVDTDSFSEVSTRVSYTLKLKKTKSALEIFGGVKNIFNAYQNDFDIGKNRDSNFIYGPAQPRSIFIGLRLRSL